MNELIQSLGIQDYIQAETLSVILRAMVILLIGLPFIIFLRRSVKNYVTKKYSPHYGMISGKGIWYLGFILLVLMVLNQFNINLAPLLGAAGVLGLAVGFASQTSVSNVISGIFLIAEKSFEVGDVITVGGTTGAVLSIDTLSVKLRTFDNRFVRIPNETMIKTEVINVSRFPIRRADIMVGVAYKEDLEKVKSLLAEIARTNPNVLNDPAPVFIFQAFGSSSLDLQFSVWAEKDNWLSVKNEMYEAIKIRFEQEDVEIPFPHISIYKGEVSDPIPVEIVTRQLAVNSEQ
jgi:small-conductance mechanosensitive channel